MVQLFNQLLIDLFFYDIQEMNSLPVKLVYLSFVVLKNVYDTSSL